MTAIVVAVRAALPSPRPQGWQALQMAVGLADAGTTVALVADAGRPDGGPVALADWLGRPLPDGLSVHVPPAVSRPPLAGLRFRFALRRQRAPILLCRDPRVAAAQPRRRWRHLVMEWHVRPDPSLPIHRAALRRADLHVTPAPGLWDDLRVAGLPAHRLLLLPNACGLDRSRARQRHAAAPENGPVLAMGLHRRGGLDLALRAWADHDDLPPLWIAGRDQGGVRVGGWQERIDARGLGARVRLVGPVWGHAREDLIDRCAVWLAAYPADDDTRTRLCPLQVADALGSGRPLVAPDLPSIRALGGQPTLYGADSPDALAAAIRRARLAPITPPDTRPRWADRARTLLDALASLPVEAA